MAIRFENKTDQEPEKKAAKVTVPAPAPVDADAAEAEAPPGELPFGKPSRPEKKRKGR